MKRVDTLLGRLRAISESRRRINESNGSEALVKKYFNDVDGVMPDGEDDSILSSDSFSTEEIQEFENIIKKVSTGKVLKFNSSKNGDEDQGYTGPSLGTDFTIKGKSGAYITGSYKQGAIAWGVGDPSQSAILIYYGK